MPGCGPGLSRRAAAGSLATQATRPCRIQTAARARGGSDWGDKDLGVGVEDWVLGGGFVIFRVLQAPLGPGSRAILVDASSSASRGQDAGGSRR
eukprot:982449-Pyramimonas_sp.AAC.1